MPLCFVFYSSAEGLAQDFISVIKKNASGRTGSNKLRAMEKKETNSTEFVVKGTVKDDKGYLEGVTVFEKGTKRDNYY